MMSRKSVVRIVATAAVLFGLIGSAVAQEQPQPQNDAGNRGDRGNRGNRGDRGPGGGRDRGGRDRGGPGRGGPPDFTPEQREQFYTQMVQRQMERLTSTYALTPEQQTQVQSKLDEIKLQQQAYSEAHRQEFDSMRDQMRQLHETGTRGDAAFEQQHDQLRNRMHTLFEAAPLMNSEKVTSEVEKLLPPEQVEQGRARHAQYEAERRQRFEEMRRRMEERRQQWQQGNNSSGENGPGGSGQGPPWMRFGRRDSNGAAFAQDQAAPEIRENPIGPWEQYVRDFTRRYGLDVSQQATAQSILREMQTRRTAYEQTHRVDYETAKAMDNEADRDARLAELNGMVVGLFDELKLRLDRVPTSEQRRAVGGPSTTRPASATSAPAVTTTQPTDSGQRSRDGRSSRGSRRSSGQ